MDVIDELIIRMKVDNVPFEASIYPNGSYIIWGPVWRGGEGNPPMLSAGKLGYGYDMSGLRNSLAELIRLRLKS